MKYVISSAMFCFGNIWTLRTEYHPILYKICKKKYKLRNSELSSTVGNSNFDLFFLETSPDRKYETRNSDFNPIDGVHYITLHNILSEIVEGTRPKGQLGVSRSAHTISSRDVAFLDSTYIKIVAKIIFENLNSDIFIPKRVLIITVVKLSGVFCRPKWSVSDRRLFLSWYDISRLQNLDIIL